MYADIYRKTSFLVPDAKLKKKVDLVPGISLFSYFKSYKRFSFGKIRILSPPPDKKECWKRQFSSVYGVLDRPLIRISNISIS